jgi:hypothetical protein
MLFRIIEDILLAEFMSSRIEKATMLVEIAGFAARTGYLPQFETHTRHSD